MPQNNEVYSSFYVKHHLIANNLNSGVKCSSNGENVIIRTGFFCKLYKG